MLKYGMGGAAAEPHLPGPWAKLYLVGSDFDLKSPRKLWKSIDAHRRMRRYIYLATLYFLLSLARSSSRMREFWGILENEYRIVTIRFAIQVVGH
jgi:hypothetical protein